MKSIIFIMVALISSSVYAQESVKVIKLKSSEAETVTGVLDVLKDDKDKRPSMEKMAEVMFKRIDVDKNGSLSLKEFQTFYARIRGSRSDSSDRGRSDRGRSDRGRSDRGGSDRGRPDRSNHGDSQQKTQGFGKDKQDDSKGDPKSRGG